MAQGIGERRESVRMNNMADAMDHDYMYDVFGPNDAERYFGQIYEARKQDGELVDCLGRCNDPDPHRHHADDPVVSGKSYRQQAAEIEVVVDRMITMLPWRYRIPLRWKTWKMRAYDRLWLWWHR